MSVKQIMKLEDVSAAAAAENVSMTNTMIIKNSLPMNEGHPTQVCGNIVAFTVETLNNMAPQTKDTKQCYRFEVFPVIHSCLEDRKHDKKSDYVIMKVINARTLIVIELKLDVGNSLTGADKDHLAQLFYEAHLVCHQEKCCYPKLLCIYADHKNWYFFLTDMTKDTKNCLSY